MHTKITFNTFKFLAIAVLLFINTAKTHAVFFNQYNFFHSHLPTDHSEKIIIYASNSLENVLNPVFEHYVQASDSDISVIYSASPYALQQLAQGVPMDLILTSEPKQLKRLASNGWIQEPIELWQNRLAFVKSPPINESSTQRFMSFFSQPKPPKVNANSYTNEIFNIMSQLSWDNVIQLNTLNGRKIGLCDPITCGLGSFTDQILDKLPFKEKVLLNSIYAYDTYNLNQDLKNHKVEFGIIYYSDAIKLFENELVALLPESMHEPIIYSLAVVNKPSIESKMNKLKNLIDHLQSIPISMQMLESGLTLPSLNNTSSLDDFSPTNENSIKSGSVNPLDTDIRGLNVNGEDLFHLGNDDKSIELNTTIKSPLKPEFDIKSISTDAEQKIAPLEEIK